MKTGVLVVRPFKTTRAITVCTQYVIVEQQVISPHPLSDHVATMVLDDQVFSNPKSYNSYDREVVGDVDAFIAGQGAIETINTVETAKLGITIPYSLNKTYTWVQTEGLGDAVIGRSWIEGRFCNDGGGTCLEHTYSIDLFLAEGDETLRLTATWSELVSPLDGLATEEFLIAQLAKGLVEVFDSSDEFIEEGMPEPED